MAVYCKVGNNKFGTYCNKIVGSELDRLLLVDASHLKQEGSVLGAYQQFRGSMPSLDVPLSTPLQRRSAEPVARE